MTANFTRSSTHDRHPPPVPLRGRRGNGEWCDSGTRLITNIMPITTMNLDQKLIQKSRQRLIISGNTFELYQYENPYLYNLPPLPRGDRTSPTRPRPRRADNLYRARQRIRRLIASNTGIYGEKLKFITYTFKKNITDLGEANKLWTQYQKKMRRTFGTLKYLCVVEFQKRGAIHYHVLYFNLPFIYDIKSKLRHAWSHGHISCKVIDHVKHVGAYVSKYLVKEVLDLRLARQKAYFTSRHLKQPKEKRNELGITQWKEDNSHAILNSKVQGIYQSERFGRITYTQGITHTQTHGLQIASSHATQDRTQRLQGN